MDKERAVSFAGSIIVFFVLLFAYSKWGPAIPFSTISQNKGEPLQVSGSGKVVVIPDIAKITIGIEEQGQTLRQVQNNVNAKSKKLIEELKKLGIDEKNIKTVTYNVYPEYDYQNTPLKINGYRVSSVYEVKIVDFEVINNAVVVATDNGANTIGDIVFEVNEKTREESIKKAREEAVEKAKAKAKDLAQATGITLGKVTNVSESQDPEPRRIIMYEKAVSNPEPSLEAKITPGETEIQVSVTLSFEVR